MFGFNEIRGRQPQYRITKKLQLFVMAGEPCGGVGEGFVQVLQLLPVQVFVVASVRIGNQLAPELLQLLFTVGSNHSNLA